MPFIKNYEEAIDVLDSMKSGKCAGRCRRIWMTNLKYALETKPNPLKLSASERKNMTEKFKN